MTTTHPDTYAAEGGGRCPVCQSENLSGTEVEIEGHLAFQEVMCLDCNAGWNDVYKLDSYSALEEAEPTTTSEGEDTT